MRFCSWSCPIASTIKARTPKHNKQDHGLRHFDIVGIGLAGWDVSIEVPAFPYDDRTHIVARSQQGGGMTANTMVVAQRLGLQCAMVTTVGDDSIGHAILEDLRSEGVDTRYTAVQGGRTSPTAYCLAERTTGRKMIIGCPATVRGLGRRHLSKELSSEVTSSRVLHVDGWHPDASLEAMSRARSAGVPVSYDAGHVPNKAELLLRGSDLVIASEAFVGEFFGRRPHRHVLGEMRAFGPKMVAITLGERGVLARMDSQVYRLGVFGVEAVDTTGAGDAFHGGFLAAYLRGHDFGGCLWFASAVAAMCCRKLSGRAGLPISWRAVRAFMKRTPYLGPKAARRMQRPLKLGSAKNEGQGTRQKQWQRV